MLLNSNKSQYLWSTERHYVNSLEPSFWPSLPRRCHLFSLLYFQSILHQKINVLYGSRRGTLFVRLTGEIVPSLIPDSASLHWGGVRWVMAGQREVGGGEVWRRRAENSSTGPWAWRALLLGFVSVLVRQI